MTASLRQVHLRPDPLNSPMQTPVPIKLTQPRPVLSGFLPRAELTLLGTRPGDSPPSLLAAYPPVLLSVCGGDGSKEDS